MARFFLCRTEEDASRRRLPIPRLWHLNANMKYSFEYKFRMPADPEPFPIQEPPDPPENPDMPVREPDPEDPGQI
jgi:hypothetical protein